MAKKMTLEVVCAEEVQPYVFDAFEQLVYRLTQYHQGVISTNIVDDEDAPDDQKGPAWVSIAGVRHEP